MESFKLVVFDLDGVLLDSKELHFEALNLALSSFSESFVITPSEHSTKYDGLSTRRKLELLHSDKALPEELFEEIWRRKQEITIQMLGKISRDAELVSYLEFAKSLNTKIALASNSVRKTILIILENLGVKKYFDLILSNEDVLMPKPHPEIYWKTMTHFKVLPEETVIFEDSYVGRLAAIRSGAKLIPVDNRFDLDWDKIRQLSFSSSTINLMRTPWKSDKLNVLIPMAGAGSRFEVAGYTFPKPLIEVHGKPMIQVVIENLNIEAKFIFIVQKSHFEKYNLGYLLRLIAPNCEIVQIEGITEGAACTTLLARTFIDNDESLIIANSDQFVEWNSGETIYSFMADGIDGGLVTFKSTHPKWSYAKLDTNGVLKEVAEKKVISDTATVGIYYWKKGSEYVKYADQMIRNNVRTNGEFYVCPVFNEAILDGKVFRTRNVEEMWGLGTPEDLDYFLKNWKKD